MLCDAGRMGVEMVKRPMRPPENAIWKAGDGRNYAVRSWKPLAPEGQIILLHGLGEHSGRYERLAAYFNQFGWQIDALDLPGHGKSPGLRGSIPAWSNLLELIEAFIAAHRVPSLPLFIYGHSWGAGLALQITIRGKVKFQGVVASSPPLKLFLDMPAWQQKVARLLEPLTPWLQVGNGISEDDLSHDQSVIENYLADPLVHDRVSLRLGVGLISLGDWLRQHASRLKTPLLLMHGNDDRVTDIEGSREFCQLAGNSCYFVEWPGLRHELHNEMEWRQVAAAIASWLDDQIHLIPRVGLS
jgi:alpha-beta hydrolase superfamily lysophospholipase